MSGVENVPLPSDIASGFAPLRLIVPLNSHPRAFSSRGELVSEISAAIVASLRSMAFLYIFYCSPQLRNMPGQFGSVKLQRDHWQRKTFSWFSEEQDRNCPVGLPWTVGESAAFSCIFGTMRLRRRGRFDSLPAFFVSEDTLR